MKILLLIFSFLSTNLPAKQVTQSKTNNKSYENDDEDYEEEEYSSKLQLPSDIISVIIVVWLFYAVLF